MARFIYHQKDSNDGEGAVHLFVFGKIDREEALQSLEDDGWPISGTTCGPGESFFRKAEVTERGRGRITVRIEESLDV